MPDLFLGRLQCLKFLSLNYGCRIPVLCFPLQEVKSTYSWPYVMKLDFRSLVQAKRENLLPADVGKRANNFGCQLLAEPLKLFTQTCNTWNINMKVRILAEADMLLPAQAPVWVGWWETSVFTIAILELSFESTAFCSSWKVGCLQKSNGNRIDSYSQVSASKTKYDGKTSVQKSGRFSLPVPALSAYLISFIIALAIRSGGSQYR